MMTSPWLAPPVQPAEAPLQPAEAPPLQPLEPRLLEPLHFLLRRRLSKPSPLQRLFLARPEQREAPLQLDEPLQAGAGAGAGAAPLQLEAPLQPLEPRLLEPLHFLLRRRLSKPPPLQRLFLARPLHLLWPPPQAAPLSAPPLQPWPSAIT